ncbi:hypothetical protein VHA01S_031_00270 [Vibrio halioticoli NBRC 102217]|uniref:Oxidoreductase n=1 Tax=Vibrio halioticoli NBRC 102217 TaxID=1219072 RepID=V5F462_9VIBR|nr:SDR family oxidoreductase [Vibrio halioticoli]GAD90014.1 hypothetical protein VHA01S_031_00270 [Vibrio halioticoli NBRC 102217]
MDELEQVPLNEIHIVHAAGQYEKTPLLTESGDPSLFKQHFDVHVFLIYELISSLVPLIRSAQQTALITISTNLTERANRDSYGYIASKAALESLTKQFAFNLGQYNFQSNCLCPGYFLSNMNGFNEEIEERVMDNSPTGKRLTPEQLARAIVALFHADFHGLTGAKIQFDGGNTLGF